MTDLDDAERKALFILFLQSQTDEASYGSGIQLNSAYHAQIPKHLLQSAFQKWVNEGLAKADRSSSEVKYRLRRDRFAEAYRRVLELYHASAITVYADTREILSDISPANDFPMKEGWKWLTYENEKPEGGTLYAHNQTLIPAPPISGFNFNSIDWTKWGAIAAIIAIPLAVILWFFS